MVLPLRQPRAYRGFEGLYREYVGDIYKYALAVTGNPSDAEDVTQTTFLNAFRAFQRGERPLKPQNWLLTIAHNVCRQRTRHAWNRPREVVYDDDIAEAPAPADDAPSAADITRALSHLPYTQRATLIMRELEGRTHAEIAEVLGLTVAATEMLAFRARRSLREHLAGSLTCRQAESALDRQSDGMLGPEEAGQLRAHVRECNDCARLARRVRAQRGAWRALAAAPLPVTLQSFTAGSGAAVGSFGAGLAAKSLAAIIVGATIGSGSYVARQEIDGNIRHAKPRPTPVVLATRARTQAAAPVRSRAAATWTPARLGKTLAPNSAPVRGATRPPYAPADEPSVPAELTPAFDPAASDDAAPAAAPPADATPAAAQPDAAETPTDTTPTTTDTRGPRPAPHPLPPQALTDNGLHTEAHGAPSADRRSDHAPSVSAP